MTQPKVRQVFFLFQLVAVATLAGFASAAHAAPKLGGIQPAVGSVLPRTQFDDKTELSADDPVLLEAGQVDYQQNGKLVIASGGVTISQGDTILMADTLAYDQEDDLVIAQGHVSILQPSGSVYFADEVGLQHDLKQGVIRQFKARFSDNSVVAAAYADKQNESLTKLFKAAYSPCKCTDDETKEPIHPQWKITSGEALIDEEKQEITYDNVWFNVYDLPAFYTPYLSHAMPGADNKSGILMPEYFHTASLGSVYKIPYYYAMAKNRDLTITPMVTTEEGVVMIGEYREKFDSGILRFDGSITNAQNRNAAGKPIAGHERRGHINANGKFIIDPDTNWGFDIRRVTDDTYLRRYDLGGDVLLTSKAYAEGFNLVEGNNRTYGSVTGLTFQGLTAQDNSDRIPTVLPLAVFAYQSDPGLYHSRFTFGGNMLSLYRDTGSDSRRLSATPGWTLPFISEGGQVIEFNAQMRTDVYSVNDVALTNGKTFDGTTGRAVPEVSALWYYPFINRFDGESSLVIEPVVMAAVSPDGGNPEKIPNEDSSAPEFTDTNLFEPNRFAGYDRIETGTRVSYGLRGQGQFFGDKYVDWLIGQNYRVNSDHNFPFSNDLSSHFSDYVGKVGLTYNSLLIAYRFRTDSDGFAAKRQEVETLYSGSPVTLSLSYLSLRNDPILSTQKLISGNASVNLSEDWTWTMNASKNLLIDQMTGSSTGLIFKNECTYISGTLSRNYTKDRDLQPGLTLFFSIAFKNLN